MMKLTPFALVLGVTLSVWANSAVAAEFGAFAFSPSSGAYGYSHNFSTRQQAEGFAMKNCRNHGRGCRVVLWFRDTCAALAVGQGNGHGYAWAASKRQAEERAMMHCRDYARGCKVRQSLCSK